MVSNRTIIIKGNEVSISTVNEQDYISLTDMARGVEDGNSAIERWLRGKDTIEYLGIWEQFNNTDFNYPEFEGIKNTAGTNRFSLSVKKWITLTHAKGITARTGRYGSGTYAHKDIAFEFGTWLSPEFKFYLVREFERLKADEAKRLNHDWDVRRLLSKINYHLHTDSIKTYILPERNLPKNQEGIVYADEAEILY